MAVLDILQDWQEEGSILHRKTVRIRKVDRRIRRLLNDMVETMREAGGVGLAAPQVGRNLSALVIEYADTDEDPDAVPELYKILNPLSSDSKRNAGCFIVFVKMRFNDCLMCISYHTRVNK